MVWGRLDDMYPLNRKVRPLSDAAFRLDVSGICWSNKNKTDGRVPAADLGTVSDARRPKRAVVELVHWGRWHEPGHDCDRCPQISDGWVIHDFPDYNRLLAQTEEIRGKRAEAGRRGGQASGRRRANGKQVASDLPSNAEATAEQNRTLVPKVPSSYVSSDLTSVDATS